ncbi:hypothetical protein [Solimonas marina]|uniref:Uncharacterized protein n=1 Tax=Solimonas marina TaxID=2714601 RepID=A0A970B872_9GAMM|nr:hypothetical protein [Solimonas marina]NKF24683.1 hypothetical protein [Solimonas marina]
MIAFDEEVEAARRLLEQRHERVGDFCFYVKEHPRVQCADGRCLSTYDVEVTTKRRGVRVAAYVGGQTPSWLDQFEADLRSRRFVPEGD